MRTFSISTFFSSVYFFFVRCVLVSSSLSVRAASILKGKYAHLLNLMEFHFCCRCARVFMIWHSQSSYVCFFIPARATRNIFLYSVKSSASKVQISFVRQFNCGIEWRKHFCEFIDCFVSRFQIAQFTHRRSWRKRENSRKSNKRIKKDKLCLKPWL